MESALNLVWALLAAAMIRLWMAYAHREGAVRWAQPIALTMSLLILFPAISMTDDLLAAQNPAIADVFVSCQRRDHAVDGQHHDFPASAGLPVPILSELNFSFLRSALGFNLPIPSVDRLALAPLQSRPPPVA
jgi:hypothetical protein